MTDTAPAKKSDLGVRVVSAIVMIAIAGGALWAGGWVFTAFVGLIALGLLWEWWGLVSKFAQKVWSQVIWISFGLVYIGGATALLAFLRNEPDGLSAALVILLAVIATDVGAYFAGRTIGGPKIAPSISPSKTWAGLAGGIVGAISLLLVHSIAASHLDSMAMRNIDLTGSDAKMGPVTFDVVYPYKWIASAILGGAVIAIVAQAGDFFESWMKRRAGVKDSGTLIPGHGGLLDRMDGLLAVLFFGSPIIAFLSLSFQII